MWTVKVECAVFQPFLVGTYETRKEAESVADEKYAEIKQKRHMFKGVLCVRIYEGDSDTHLVQYGSI